LVDGLAVAFAAYNIEGNNYYMLRDVAYVLRGTKAQFDVAWDGYLNVVSLARGVPYSPIGGEMAGEVAYGTTAEAIPTTAAVFVDGVRAFFRAYNIGGNNFFMLRDLGVVFGFVVDWDESAATVMIESGGPAPWAYHINRNMGLFEHRGDADFFTTIGPQTVNVLAQEGSWLQIGTWLGPKWIDTDFMPPVHELTNALRRFESSLSVYYENLETGFVYGRNAERAYFSASVAKAPYSLYIYQKAERGETDLESRLTFTAADFDEGSGIISHRHRFGETFTQRELLRLNISESDNAATRMLIRAHRTDGYRRFVESIGGNPGLVRNMVMDSNITANEAGLFAREIYKYIESGGTYSEEFKAALLNNRTPFLVSDYPLASKTGWTREIAWHDMAIVYAPSPYTLTVLTERFGWGTRDYRDFEEISAVFQSFNDFWFTTHGVVE
jgi:hypothetical protein